MKVKIRSEATIIYSYKEEKQVEKKLEELKKEGFKVNDFYLAGKYNEGWFLMTKNE